VTDSIAQTEPSRVEVESRPVRVTFFEDRAEVFRTGKARVPSGTITLSVRGVTALVDDKSVQPRILGDAKLLSARVCRRIHETQAGTDQDLRDTETDQKRARIRRTVAERTLEAAQVHEARTVQLVVAWMTALGRVPRGAVSTLSGWRAAFSHLLSAQKDALDRTSAAAIELSDAKEDEQRARLRYEAARKVRPKKESTVEIQVAVPQATELSFELTYITPCALWRPEHTAKLAQHSDGSSSLHITTQAVLWQRCGEEWTQVSCRFSTARPAQHASPPLLSDDVLRLRRKTDSERKVIVVEAREQSITVAGLAHGGQKVEEMPGVDDGGEPLVFEAARPLTLASNGQPVRVEISRSTMAAQVERVVFPERGIAAHLRATATLQGATPLLAGPVVLVRGTELCGRSRTAFVGRGEPFELGFGPDDAIRVRRHISEERDQSTLTGTQRVGRTVKLYVSNLSATSRRVLITERIPVSEIREIEIVVKQTSGMRWDGKDGFAHFELDLSPQGQKELLLTYQIEAPSRVQLPPA